MDLADDMLNGVAAAARHCGLPARSIYNMVGAKTVPFKRVGRRVFFRKSELDAFFRADVA